MSRTKARLTRDYGMDPERQNLFDGSFNIPSVRSLLGYSSTERRLERSIIKMLLRYPEEKSVRLESASLRLILGEDWLHQIEELGQQGLHRVSLLVCEACIRVRVLFSNGAIVAQVY